MNEQRQKVINYYKSLESRLGYTFLTWNTKHFGYYPSGKRDMGEKEAQILMTELLAKKLQIKNSDLVLDAGCGRGTAACYLAKKYGANVIGIDIVPFELKMAKDLVNNKKLGNKVKFYLKDYSATGFPNNHFDKVFTLETLVHSPNLDKTLKELYRILKPKGRLVLFEYSRAYPKEFTKLELKMLGIINEYSSMTSFNKMFHDTLVKSVEKAGFKILIDEEITKHILPSLERFSAYAKVPYKIIKVFSLQKYFVNTTAGVEFYKFVRKGLVRYRTIVAEKTTLKL